MTKNVDLENKWAVLIGRLFIVFGGIEKATHDCLKKWVDDTVYTHVKHMRFASRIDLVIDLISKLNHTDKNKDNLIAELKKAKELGKKRNIIAHNPLMLVLFQGESNFIEAITHNTKEDVTMEFHEFEGIVKKSEEIYANITHGLAMLHLEDCGIISPHDMFK